MKRKIKTQNAFCKSALTKSEYDMAKTLGISEETLRRNIRNPSESWKDPIALRIRRMYDEKFDTVSGEDFYRTTPGRKSKKVMGKHQRQRIPGLSEKERRMAEALELDREKLLMIQKKSGDPGMFNMALYVRRRYERERRAT